MSNHVNYIERTRDYYRAQGFKQDYTWARHDTVPFTLPGPGVALRDCRVTLVTTAVPNPEIPKAIRKAESIAFDQVPDNFDTADLSWDKDTTHTDDRQSFFPTEVLHALATENVIKEVAPRFHFVPTEFSQRATIDEDAPAIRKACLDDGVHIAILIPL